MPSEPGAFAGYSAILADRKWRVRSGCDATLDYFKPTKKAVTKFAAGLNGCSPRHGQYGVSDTPQHHRCRK